MTKRDDLIEAILALNARLNTIKQTRPEILKTGQRPAHGKILSVPAQPWRTGMSDLVELPKIGFTRGAVVRKFGTGPNMRVVSIEKNVADKFVSIKHYSRRPSIFWAGFGLEIAGHIEGVCVFGQPSAPIQRHAFKNRDFRLYELARLVVQTDTKNAASFLEAGALNLLPKPCAVVSYADSEMGHCGIIYQATNWVYTGSTISHDHLYIVDGVRTHPMTLRDRGITAPKQWAIENGIETVKPMPKHRYFFFLGNKKQRKDIKHALNYPIVDVYPKSPKTRYEDGPKIIEPLLPQPEGTARAGKLAERKE